jgi:hypothetical protein
MCRLVLASTDETYVSLPPPFAAQLAAVKGNQLAWSAVMESLQVKSTHSDYDLRWWAWTKEHSLFRSIWSLEQDWKDCKVIGAHQIGPVCFSPEPVYTTASLPFWRTRAIGQPMSEESCRVGRWPHVTQAKLQSCAVHVLQHDSRIASCVERY